MDELPLTRIPDKMIQNLRPVPIRKYQYFTDPIFLSPNASVPAMHSLLRFAQFAEMKEAPQIPINAGYAELLNYLRTFRTLSGLRTPFMLLGLHRSSDFLIFHI